MTVATWTDPALPDHRYVVRCEKGFYHDVENCGIDWTFGDRLGAAQLGWKRMSEHVAVMARLGFANIVVMDATRILR